MAQRERVSRARQVDLEIRGTDGRTITGLAAPFNRPAEVLEGGRRFEELFRPGAFTRTIAERGDRVKALAAHDVGKLPIGRAARLWEDRDGLWTELAISDTRDGADALQLVRDGALDGLSVGMVVIGDDWSHAAGASVRAVTEAKLYEISLVAIPAYDEARVVGVRSALGAPIDLLRRRLDLEVATWKEHA